MRDSLRMSVNGHAADAVPSGSRTRRIATERRSSESRAYVLRQESAPCVLLVHAAADLARVLLVIGIASASRFSAVRSRKFQDSELGYGLPAQLQRSGAAKRHLI